ncbi:MAG: hypothetical protein FWD75_01305 [Propionibacteriaceae bacterium]|nr:hypothetical protein [Propionibacteriaceae bacterium]
MGDDDLTPDRAPLTVLAERYEAIKREVASGLRARQEASRFGGEPAGDGDAPAPGKQDARKITAERLGAGVSHTSLEKVLWLRHVAFDVDRRASLRREAMDALEAVDGGEPVNWPYQRIHTLVLIDDLEQAAADAPDGSVVKIMAERHLKALRERGIYGVTAPMKRQARKALADARRLDQEIDETGVRIGPGWPQVEASLKRRRREGKAAYDRQVADRLKAMAETQAGGGANP